MKGTLLFLDFSLWYYTRAIRDLLAVWTNFMWFVVHYFSIPLLLRTLFAPWKRMTDEYHRTSIEMFLQTLVVNTMSRIFGAVIRLSLVFTGVFILILGIADLFIILALWVALPIVVVVSLLYGGYLFIS